MTGAPQDADAVAIRVSGVSKSFKRRTIRAEYTSFKSELVNWFKRRNKSNPQRTIDALREIDFTIPRGRTVGILGRNGSGKSTLLKLITGIYAPTTGSIEVNGRISALLDLGAGFHPDFSGRENILINGIILGMSRPEVRARMDEIIAFSELGEFIDEPVRTYSSGMYMRLAFAVATHVDPEILIVDEILAVGDEHFSKKSMAKMEEFKAAGKTIVMVTHELSTVERWCDHAIWIDGGRVRAQGRPSELVADYRAAVLAAQTQGVVLVPAALAPDGGALPETIGSRVEPQAPVAASTQESPQAVGPVAVPESVEPAASGEPSLSRVRLEDGKGQQRETYREGESLAVRVNWNNAGDLPNASLRVELRTAFGGRLVAVASERVGGSILTQPLNADGELGVVFESLAVRPGSYRIEVQLRPTASLDAGPRLQAPFEVLPAGAGGTLLPLSARWVLPEASGPREQTVEESLTEVLSQDLERVGS
jgi:lipopolysaccharide transport system ATP-binding protein